MDKDKKHRVIDFDRFLAYFKDLLSHRDRHKLEKEAMQDPFSEEAFEGLSALSPQELEEDVRELQRRIDARTRKKDSKLYPYIRYAAAAILVLGLGTTFLLIRHSLRKAPATGSVAEVVDSLEQTQDKVSLSDDSLKKNIALTEQAKEKSISKEIRKSKKLTTASESASEHSPGEKVTEENEKSKVGSTAEAEREEVVVTGYGIQKKQELGGTISYEKIETADEIEVISPDRALQGRAAGVEVERSRRAKESKAVEEEMQLDALACEEHAEGDARTIRGVVVSSSDGEPLPGVSVVIKGTTTGTVTDLQGNFELPLPETEKSDLVFSYVGFEEEEVTVSNYEDITLAMTEDLLALDEVVVVGYGTQKKSDLTGSVSTVRSEDFNQTPEAAPRPVIIEPQPSVGTRDFKDYIKQNIRYDQLPPLDKAVVVKLVLKVTATGDITEITIKRSSGRAFDNEAKRLIKEGPRWIAGTVDGVAADDEVSVRIKFEPQE